MNAPSPPTAAAPLSRFTVDELLEEIIHRRNLGREAAPREWCEDCMHGRLGDPLVCEVGHTVTWHSPTDYDEAHTVMYGHYRRVCADRNRKQ